MRLRVLVFLAAVASQGLLGCYGFGFVSFFHNMVAFAAKTASLEVTHDFRILVAVTLGLILALGVGNAGSSGKPVAGSFLSEQFTGGTGTFRALDLRTACGFLPGYFAFGLGGRGFFGLAGCRGRLAFL
jgi:predicted membrane protein